MSKTIKGKIGADAVLTLTFSVNANEVLAPDIDRLDKTISKGSKEKNFSIGDTESGRVEVKKKFGGSWGAKGVDGEIEGQNFIFNKVSGKTLEIDEVAHEMARMLAFLTADVDDIASRVERKYGIDIDKDELAELISANIEMSGFEREFAPQ